MLAIQPCSLAQARAFVSRWHRHHPAPGGHKFSVAAHDGTHVVGVVMVGRPVARHWDDGSTLEVTRCCVLDGIPNAASFLYGAARRAAFDLGYARIITYTLAAEPGTSLKASGWTQHHAVKGRSWTTPSRPRVDKHPTTDKWCWISENPKAVAPVPWLVDALAPMPRLSFEEVQS